MADKQHSIVAPSSASVWHECTGMIQLKMQRLPSDESTQDQMEGDAVHWAGASMILDELGRLPESGTTDFIPGVREGFTAPNGIVLNPEMMDAAEVYADFVTDTYYKMSDRAGEPCIIGVEETIDCHGIHSECFGTPDAWVWSPKLNELFIPDLKYGHLFVPAEDNKAMICYTSGLARKYELNNDAWVTIAIVQPRSYHASGPIRTWRVQYRDLLLKIGVLTTRAARSLGPEATLKTGSHCKYCDVRLRCGPFLQSAQDLFELASQPIPCDMDNQSKGILLSLVESAQERLKSLQSALSEQISTQIRYGEIVPGWGLNPSSGREKWNRPVDEIIQLGQMLGLDLSKPEAKTPNQARKLGMDENMVKIYSERKTGLSLAKTDPNAAQRAFGKNYDGGKLA